MCKHAQHAMHRLVVGRQWDNPSVCIYTGRRRQTLPLQWAEQAPTAQTGDGPEELSLRLWWKISAPLFGWEKPCKLFVDGKKPPGVYTFNRLWWSSMEAFPSIPVHGNKYSRFWKAVVPLSSVYKRLLASKK